MPLRLRNVRVALERAENTKDASGFLNDEPQRIGFLRMDLFPLSGDQVARFSGAGFDADWRGLTFQPTPEVRDGDSIVTLARDGAAQQRFRVTKKVLRGVRQDLALKEIGADQPPDAPPTP